MRSEPVDRAATVDRMLTRARLERRRGQFAAAWQALDDALLLAPDSPDVLEEMGYLNLDEGEPEAAAQCFRRVLDLSPGRAGAEIGLGNATIEATRAELAEAQDDQPDTSALAKRSGSHAATLSSLLPGLGQMYATEFGRGWAFLLAAMPCWYLTFWGVMSRIIPGAKEAPAALLSLGLTGVIVIHGFAGWDAWQAVQRLHDERRQVL